MLGGTAVFIISLVDVTLAKTLVPTTLSLSYSCNFCLELQDKKDKDGKLYRGDMAAFPECWD